MIIQFSRRLKLAFNNIVVRINLRDSTRASTPLFFCRYHITCFERRHLTNPLPPCREIYGTHEELSLLERSTIVVVIFVFVFIFV